MFVYLSILTSLFTYFYKDSLNNIPGHLESSYNWSLLLTWSYSIAVGMEYLASKKIMHGDLAARNILIGENFSAKIR